MLSRIRMLSSSVGLAVLAIAFGNLFPATTAMAATSAPELEAVAGANADLFLRINPGPWLGWHGQMIGAPAVASNPTSAPPDGQGSPFVVVTGIDHNLWTVNQLQGWQPLSSTPAYCIDNPAAVITSAHAAGAFVLTVACQGADHALWFAQTQAGTLLAPLPLVWQTLGGAIVNGPAVAPVDPIHRTVNGELTFFVNGTDGRVWARTLDTGWSPMPWQCLGHPAAAATLSTLIPTTGQVTVFACQGTDHTLWFSRNFGSGWVDTQSLGGVLIDGPGVAVGPSTATFFVEGADQAGWHRTITHVGNVFNWTSDGGILQFGVGAAALLSPSDNP